MFSEGSIFSCPARGCIADVTPSAFEKEHYVYRYGLSMTIQAIGEMQESIFDFSEEYLNKVKALHANAGSLFQDSFKMLGRDRFDDFLGEINQKINDLYSLCNINKKIQNLKNARGTSYRNFYQLAQTTGKNLLKSSVNSKINSRIINSAEQFAKGTIVQAKSCLNTIKDCPYGHKKIMSEMPMYFKKAY